MRKLSTVVAIALPILLAGCADSTEAPPTPSAGAFEGSSDVASIDAAALTDESSDPDALQEVLDGAEDYLAWVTDHPEDLIGAATPASSDASDGVFFTHEPGGCCPNKDVSSVLGAWTDGEVVWTVVVAGPSATVAVADGIRASMEEGGASAPPSPSSRY